MTTKRFNRVGGYVYDGDKCISHFEDVSHRDDIVKLLNELHEERNYFERKKCEYWNEFNLAHLDNIQLRQENEQLKQSLARKQRRIDAYEDYINTLKEDGVLND